MHRRRREPGPERDDQDQRDLAAAAPPNQITNTAVVDPDSTIEESNELNNTSATVNTSLVGPPPGPLLTIDKTDGKPNLPGAWDTAPVPTR